MPFLVSSLTVPCLEGLAFLGGAGVGERQAVLVPRAAGTVGLLHGLC